MGCAMAKKSKKKSKKKRKAGSGKAKGSSFEREICKRLSLWWTRGKSDQVFWRNSGFLTRGGTCVEHQYGDVHSISDEGKWFVSNVNVELKFYKDLRVLDVIDKPDKRHVTLLDHWCQCMADAEASKREPLLIAKRNFAEPFVVCRSDFARDLVEKDECIRMHACGYFLSVFPLTALEGNSAGDFMFVLGGLEQYREEVDDE